MLPRYFDLHFFLHFYLSAFLLCPGFSFVPLRVLRGFSRAVYWPPLPEPPDVEPELEPLPPEVSEPELEPPVLEEPEPLSVPLPLPLSPEPLLPELLPEVPLLLLPAFGLEAGGFGATTVIWF